MRKRIEHLLVKNNPKKIKKVKGLFVEDNTEALNLFEEVINEMISEKSLYKENVTHLYSYLLNNKDPKLFSLFFETILGNIELYRFLTKSFDFPDESQFYVHLMDKAELFPDRDTATFCLGVLVLFKELYPEKD